jgi:hypothetical protein
MKNILLPVLCFFAMQIASCSQPTMDVHPGTTKFSIKNNSRAQLQNIRWNGNNFGDIIPGEISEEKDVSNGEGYMYFTLKGEEYQTRTMVKVEKHERNSFNIHNNLFVIAENSEMLTLEEILKPEESGEGEKEEEEELDE